MSEASELAGAVLFRIAALHGLVLALVFAQELGSIRDMKIAGTREAAMLGDLYYNSFRHDAEDGWDALARTARLSQEAWTEWVQA